MKERCILVVDDDPINFEVIETLLDRFDYQLHYASDGQSAISVLDAVSPDLILLDVMMPGINGVETCKKIRSLPQWTTVPIIMVTALDNTLVLSHCIAAGANDFVTKPINSIEFQARIQSMLRIKQQYEEIQDLSALQAETVAFLQDTLDELRGNLARSLSHELNTPINGILGTLSLLEDDLEDMEIDEIKEILGWTQTSARRLEGLTQKFLIYLELELRRSPAPASAPAVAWIFPGEALMSELRALAEHAGRSADLHADLGTGQLSITERYVTIALRELLENAFKFSPPGTPVKVIGQVDETRFNLIVQDFGRGMTAEQTAKIGAFMQFDRQLYEQQGVGIGLRIVNKIVEQANGAFDIVSHAAEGTRVTLSLPLDAAIAPQADLASTQDLKDELKPT